MSAKCGYQPQGPYWTRIWSPLQWRHNEHDGVSNHQPCDCLLNRLFRRRWQKTSKLRVTGLCDKGPVTRKMFPIDDVIVEPKSPLYMSADIMASSWWKWINQNYQNYRWDDEITPVIILMVYCQIEWWYDDYAVRAKIMVNLLYSDDFSIEK